MANKTQNFDLTLPLLDEYYDIEVFNKNFTEIDKYLHIARVNYEAAIKAAQTALDSATNAALSEQNAASSATAAKSWAVGGTGSREGEDTDNAKYYAQTISKNIDAAIEAAESVKQSEESASKSAASALESAERAERAAEGTPDIPGMEAAIKKKINLIVTDVDVPIAQREEQTFYFIVSNTTVSTDSVRAGTNVGLKLVDHPEDADGAQGGPYMRIEAVE